MIFGVEVTTDNVIAAVIGIGIGIPAAIGLYATRKESEAKIWERLYHAQKEENNQITDRVQRLESQVDLLQSNFIQQVARGVAEAVKEFLKGDNHGP